MRKMLLAALAAPRLRSVPATAIATTVTIAFTQFFLARHFVAISKGYPCASDVQSLGNSNASTRATVPPSPTSQLLCLLFNGRLSPADLL
jgi:hypothetical protein